MDHKRLTRWIERMSEAIRSHPSSLRVVLNNIINEAESENLLEESYMFRLNLLTIHIKTGEFEESINIAEKMKQIEKIIDISSEFKMHASYLYRIIDNNMNNNIFTIDDCKNVLKDKYYDLLNLSSILLNTSKIYSINNKVELSIESWKAYINNLLISSFICVHFSEMIPFAMVTFESPDFLISVFQAADNKGKETVVKCLLNVYELVNTNPESVALTTQSIPLLQHVVRWLREKKKVKQAVKIERLRKKVVEREQYWETKLNAQSADDDNKG